MKTPASIGNFHNPLNTNFETPARFGDVLSLIGGVMRCGFGTLFRRMFKGPVRKAWSWKLEMIIGMSRASYDLLANLGPTRYQQVLQKILPPVDSAGARVEISEKSEVPGHWFIPPKENGSVILYLHGGGYVYGSVKTHGRLMGDIACAASSRLFAPDYRLAPEHPQPAAIEDACSAYRYLVRSGLDPKQIVIAGDSAGGGLVVLTLVALRNAGDSLPAAGVCISPWVDLSCTDQSFDSNAAFDPVTREACLVAAAGFLNGSDPRAPEVSPLFANLEGLPPLLIQAGKNEVLRDQVVEFNKRATAAGVDTTCSVYEEMVHVWHMYIDFTPHALRAIHEIADFIATETKSVIVSTAREAR